MRYIRTKDGRIVDLEKFINEEKDTPYYKDFIFEEITKDGVLKWTAVGTEQNSMEEQRGIRCHFSATLNSEIIAQADTIEELCDEIIFILEDASIPYSSPYQYNKEKEMEWFKTETEIDIGFGFMKKIKEKFLAIWTKGNKDEPILKSVAKMKGVLPNGEVDWELL